MRPFLRNLEMTILGLGFLGLAWSKDRLRGYATPNGVAKSDVEGQIAYLLDIFSSLRSFMPPQFDLRGRDVLELSPGEWSGIGVRLLAMGALPFHAIARYDLAGRGYPAFYST